MTDSHSPLDLPGEEHDEYHPDDGYHPDDEHERAPRPSGHRRAKKKKKGRFGCLFVFVVVIALVVGGLYYGVSWVSDRLAGGGEPEDFDGVASVAECATGAGDVQITVPAGYSAGQIGQLLADEGVVASSGAFTTALASSSVRDGERSMCTGMSGAQAAELMTNADYIGGAGGITITAGRTAPQTFELLSGATGIPVADFEAAAEDPAIGLPAEANGNIEGYLFPDSYNFGPEPTAVDILTQMVARWQEVATEVGLVDDAVPGYTQFELLTLASIIEKEVLLPEERPAVAEVIYDRLEDQCAGVPEGLLQMDSTVNFIKGETDTPFTTDEDRASPSPYNTYRFAGLPPGPIATPGRTAMEGAVNPSDEGYCFFVAAGDGSNSSVFAATLEEHNANVRRAQQN